MFLAAAQGYHCAREAVLESTVQRVTQLAASRKTRLEQWISERLADAAFLAASPSVRDACRGPGVVGDAADLADLKEFLRVFATRSKIYECLALCSEDNRVLVSIGLDQHGLEEFHRSGIVELARTATGPSVGRIHRHEDGELGIHFAAPVLGPEQEPVAYLFTALDYVTSIDHILRDGGGLDSSGYCYLVARDGLVLTDPGRGDDSVALRLRIDTEGLRRARAGSSGAAVYRDYRNVEVIGGFTSIPGRDLVLLVEQDASEGLAWFSTLAWRAIAVGLAVSVVVTLASFRAARKLAEPLQSLASVARRVSAGESEARVHASDSPEVAAVGSVINDMLDELQAARQRLVQTATLVSIGELSSAVVHEMRNPLSSIKLNLQALSPELDDDPRHSELARIATEQVGRLERMLSDLLNLGKPIRLNLRRSTLRDVVATAVESVREEACQLRCGLQYMDEAEHATLMLDPERVGQAIVNLLRNGLEAAGEGGEVFVKTSLEGKGRGWAIIEVSDNGPGIPDDNLDRLFQPFFSTTPDGTGLGLAIVRKLVEYHGGRVSAANIRADGTTRSRGAVFRIEFPCKANSERTRP